MKDRVLKFREGLVVLYIGLRNTSYVGEKLYDISSSTSWEQSCLRVAYESLTAVWDDGALCINSLTAF